MVCRVTNSLRRGGCTLSILEETLEEEYGRSVRLCRHMEAELASLPKGSVRARTIKGHEYHYLNYRTGNKVRSDYIPRSEVDTIRKQIDRRKQLQSALKEQKRTQKQIERALGRTPHVD